MELEPRGCRTVRSAGLEPAFVSSDELIGDVVQIAADDLRLRPDPQHVIADPFDQRRFPTSRDGAKRVSRMAGDKAEL